MYALSGCLRRSALHRDHDDSPHPLPRLGALLQVQQALFRARRRGEEAQSGTCDRVRPLLLALLRPHFGRPSAPHFCFDAHAIASKRVPPLSFALQLDVCSTAARARLVHMPGALVQNRRAQRDPRARARHPPRLSAAPGLPTYSPSTRRPSLQSGTRSSRRLCSCPRVSRRPPRLLVKLEALLPK
jgi:hypothetical protein